MQCSIYRPIRTQHLFPYTTQPLLRFVIILRSVASPISLVLGHFLVLDLKLLTCLGTSV